MRAGLVWAVVALVTVAPLLAAAASPLLEWREPVYVVAGFAGIVAMALLLVQPLLAAGALPGLAGRRGLRSHRYAGAAALVVVLVHVAGLWMTSPPDVIDALTFTAPTAFSAWGVIAMWALVIAALLAAFHRRTRLWHLAHRMLALVIAIASAAHALLIEGTMEPVSKVAACAVMVVATVAVVARVRIRAAGGMSR
ncbi:ferric reductase [Amaricoccus solimangrovi]|uniref:Ferric reductase n=1 Tax=Amaricoccus solimangrovi TaxID=2589815 RepID=A0A501WTX7_9RHOB|nr:ferric reductase [Amaricoccus solimangrovi]